MNGGYRVASSNVRLIKSFCLVLALRLPVALAQSVSALPAPDLVLRGPATSGKAHTDVRMDGDGHGTIAVFGSPDSMIQLSSLALSGDGRFLAAGATPGTVDLWDLPGRKLLRTFDGADVASLSRDGSLLATSAISILETASLKERCQAKWQNLSGSETVSRMHFSPAGDLLAITANGLPISIYETRTCTRVTSLDRTRDGDFRPTASYSLPPIIRCLRLGSRRVETASDGPGRT